MKRGSKIQFDGGHLRIPTKIRRIRRVVVLAGAGSIFIATLAIGQAILAPQPFDWDESVYAVKALSWVYGSPADSFYVYRPIGVSAIAWVFAFFASGDGAAFLSSISHAQAVTTYVPLMRFFGIFFAATAAMFLFLLAARTTSVVIALATCGIVVSSFFFLSFTPLLSNDIAAAGLLVGVMWCLWRHYLSNGRDMSLYAAAILAALAFYVRYGVALYLLVIFCATVILYMSRAYTHIKDAQEKKDAGKSSAETAKQFFFNQSLKALSLFTLFLIPHFLHSAALFQRDPLGILRFAGRAAEREYLGEGLIDYASIMPSGFGSPLIGLLMVISVVGAIGLFFIQRKNLFNVSAQEYRALYWIACIALSSVFMAGLLTHAEPRYIFFPFFLLTIFALWFVDRTVRQFHPQIALLAMVSIIGWSAWSLPHNMHRVEALYAVQDAYRNMYVTAAQTIAADNHNAGNASDRCFVWTTAEPQISLYSACHAITYNDALVLEQLSIHRDDAAYLTIFPESDKVQPELTKLAERGVVAYPVSTQDGDDIYDRAQVYRLFYAGDGGERRLHDHDEKGHK